MAPPKSTDKDLELLFEFDIDRDSRTVYFNGDIDELLVDKAVKSLIYLDSQNDGLITLRITSDGGSVGHMFALYDTIRTIKSRVRTIGTGEVCSAAVLLLACGDERWATENSWAMVHKATSASAGDADEQFSSAQAFRRYEDRMYQLIAKHSKLTSKQWKDKVRKLGEVWMEPKDMIKNGIVDKVIRPRRVKSKSKA